MSSCLKFWASHLLGIAGNSENKSSRQLLLLWGQMWDQTGYILIPSLEPSGCGMDAGHCEGFETHSAETFPMAVMSVQVTQQNCEFCSELSRVPAAGSGPADAAVPFLSWDEVRGSQEEDTKLLVWFFPWLMPEFY